MKWRPTYADGYAAGLVAGREQLLPLLNHATEQLAVKEAERVAAVQRGDALMDTLLASMGVKGVTAQSKEAAAHDAETAKQFLRNQEDTTFEEIQPGPDCHYATATEALIDPAAAEPETTH